MLKDELKFVDKSEEAVKKTGISVGVVLILISLLLWYLGKASFVYFSITGGLFVILALIAIPILRPFHKLWMMLALLMGFVMSRVILTILYYIVLTPIGLLAKIVGKKFMPLGLDKNASTYWEKKGNTAKQQIDYERQF
ncbi:MAG: hypothetical protein WAU11_11330 [Ignavibacteriaceae bacterium]